MSSKLEILVVDTGALVKNVPLWEHAKRLVSVNEVFYEIKDRATQRNVENYPVEIEYLQPKPESVKFINEFTKKTGDFCVLSAADVKVLALAYEMEVETHGSDHLRTEPLQRVTNTQVTVPVKELTEEQNKSADMDTENNEEDEWEVVKRKKRAVPMDSDAMSVASTVRSSNSSKKLESWEKIPLPGFYVPREKSILDDFLEPRRPETSLPQLPDSFCKAVLQAVDEHLSQFSYIAGFQPIFLHEALIAVIIQKCGLFSSNETQMVDWHTLLLSCGLPALSTVLRFPDGAPVNHDGYGNISRWHHHMASFSSTSFSNEIEGLALQLLQTLEKLAVDQDLNSTFGAFDEEEEEEGYESDSDGGGWITPNNIGNIAKGLPLSGKKEEESDSEEEAVESQVACITTDFAMQNVLHHIGLKVLGVDFKVIKSTRTYTLRCFACFKLCSDVSKLFCPSCGNRTLKRVSVTLNPDGTQNIWISRRRLNTRGMRFNLPRPKGGQHAVMPLLTADQRFPHQWAKKMKKVNALDPDYVASSTPFSVRDITSRAVQHGYRSIDNRGINGQLKHAKIWKPKRKRHAKK